MTELLLPAGSEKSKATTAEEIPSTISRISSKSNEGMVACSSSG
jgi:hypothetical protein